MDKEKGTNHVGNCHVCTGASPELGLPSKNCHQWILSGNVLPCHNLSLLLCVVSGEPVGYLQMSGYPLYHLLHKSINDVLCGGSWEMGVLLGEQAQKINFLMWKCGGCGSQCNGVETFIISLPFSYPISSDVSAHSKASFKVVSK